MKIQKLIFLSMVMSLFTKSFLAHNLLVQSQIEQLSNDEMNELISGYLEGLMDL